MLQLFLHGVEENHKATAFVLVMFLCYKSCMRLEEYISLSIISLNSYGIVAMLVYVAGIYKILEKFSPVLFVSLETLSGIFTIIILLDVLLFIGFVVELIVRKMRPQLLPKVNFKNRIMRFLYPIFFYLGVFVNIYSFLVFGTIIYMITFAK